MNQPTAPAAEPEHDAQVGAAPIARAASARGEWQVIRDLAPFLKPYSGRIALALALVIAGKLANLTVPMVLKKLVDGLDVAPTLLVLPVALLVAYGASRLSVTLFTELRQVVFARVMARVSRRVTLQVFRHLHALSLRFHLARRTGGVGRRVHGRRVRWASNRLRPLHRKEIRWLNQLTPARRRPTSTRPQNRRVARPHVHCSSIA